MASPALIASFDAAANPRPASGKDGADMNAHLRTDPTRADSPTSREDGMTMAQHPTEHPTERPDAHRSEQHADGADRAARPHDAEQPVEAEQPVDVKKAMLDGMGGPRGMLYSAIPVVVFATAVGFFSLPVTIGLSVAVALAITVFQLWSGKSLGAASGGLIAVVAAGGVTALTGSANDFFLIGIWAALAAGVATLASQVVGRPVTGLIWNAFHGGQHAWREDRPSLIAHQIGTLALTLMFAARFGVSQWLYVVGTTSGLAIADIVLGFPLTALAAVVVVWAFRRTTKRLVKKPAAEAAA